MRGFAKSLRRRDWPPLSGTLQGSHFLGSQRAKLPWFNIERKGTVAHTLDLFHVVADLLKHPADLAVLAFDQNDFVPGVLRLFGQPDLRRRSVCGLGGALTHAFADLDSATQSGDVFF